jgi:uncharacterized protein YllA (UPF0747 family)
MDTNTPIPALPETIITKEQENLILKLEEEKSVYGVTCHSFASLLKDKGFTREEIEHHYKNDPDFIIMANLDKVFNEK